MKGSTNILTRPVQHEKLVTWHDVIQHSKGERWKRMFMEMSHSSYVCPYGGGGGEMNEFKYE